MKYMKRTLMLSIAMILMFTLAACETGGTISEVETPEALEVERFTELDAIDLPSEISVTLEDGETATVDVLWDTSDYDSDEIGTVELSGTIVSDQHDNPDDLNATQMIEINPAGLEMTLEHVGGYSIFLNALEVTGLYDLQGEHTYFAPDDQAFESLMDTFEISEEEFYDLAFLETIIEDHIVSGGRYTDDLYEGTIESIGGENISVAINDDIVLNDEATIRSADHSIKEGVVHGLDALIEGEDLLGGIDDDLFDEEAFEILMEALEEAGISWQFLLTEDYTLFLPGEAAIETFLEDTGKTPEEVLEMDELPEILANHIVEDAFTFEEIIDDLPVDVTTYADETYTLSQEDGDLFIGDALILSQDDFEEQIHFYEIDQVLVPEALKDDLYE